MSIEKKYVMPRCFEFVIEVEGSILTVSGSLGDMDDNTVYSEDF